MVRNVASTPNLREAHETVNLSKPAVQLRGADDYTKSLMNRVATGEATESERRLFDDRVSEMQTAPPMYSRPSLDLRPPYGTSNLDLRQRHPNSPAPEVSEEQKLADYNLQLLLLEQQNKKRLTLARELDLPPPLPPRSPLNVDTFKSFPAVPDFELPVPKTKKKSAKKAGKSTSETNDLFEKPLAMNPRAPSPPKTRESSDIYGYDPAWAMPAEDFSNLTLDEQSDKKTKKDKKGKGKDKKKGPAKKQAHVEDLREEYVEAPKATREAASVYTKPFLDFMTNNPTVFHAVDAQKKELLDLGWTELDERKKWDIEPGGKYFVERNGSSMIAFSVGEDYKPGNGCAIIAGHVDALTAKLKPISEVPNKAGYVQLGVAPYAGALNNTWWDRDLGIGGRVLVKEDGRIVTKLVKLDWPIARIPTLAPHFGAAASGPFNPETQMVPIIGLESTEATFTSDIPTKPFNQPPILGSGDGPVGNFVNTQPPALVKAIGNALGLTAATYGNMVNWELELFDVQPATVGGLNKEFIFAGRLDDKLCSWAAMQALISGQQWNDAKYSSIIKMVGWFDNEEIGSGLRQGAKGNFMPLTIERAVSCLGKGKKSFANLMGRTYANSFLVSSDVTHAVNPNFLNAYLENHSPHLNVGLSVHADPNGHMTSDAVSTALLARCAESVGAKLQVFQIRNDSRSGGTIGPMLSTMTGIRAIDAGIPQLSMHSIRATTGSLDPGLGVITYMGFLNRFEHVDKEFGA